MDNKLLIFLLSGIFISISALGQRYTCKIATDTTKYDNVYQDLCDSLFQIDRLQQDGKLSMFMNESMPFPILMGKDSYHITIKVTKEENVTKGKYYIYLKLIVTVDSLAKCVSVIKSNNVALNYLAIKEIENMKFMPAKRNKKEIPYFCYVTLCLIKD